MAVPKFFEFFEAFLKVVSDGELHTTKEVRNAIAIMLPIYLVQRLFWSIAQP